LSYGFYAAAAGMDVQQARMDTLTNNLANAATPGFKSDHVEVTAFPDLLALYRVDGDNSAGLGNGAFGPLTAGDTTDFSAGPLEKTDNSTDLASGSGAFFAVQGSAGQVLYTRDGSFSVDSGGYLVTAGGHRVLGTGGPVRVGGGGFTVDAAGKVTAGKTVTQLRLVTFANPGSLVKTGDNLYTAAAGATAARDPQVRQGYLEGSNVNLIKEMVDMLDAERSFQSDQKMMQVQDDIMNQSSKIGSPS